MKILFFSQARNLAGCSECRWDPESTQTTESLWTHLLEHYPELKKIRSQTRLARNGELANSATRFEKGDEVALIPPVSGG
ncbi:MAG: MoaD/ThiS family protein [Opitutales bacterium]|nr:MoaD/ThiS family protein [Opitutales bacterium]